jgi:REP element-mobilizing transposase RayT
MRHRLYVHLVWTTRRRAPLIDARLARFLCRVLRALARKEHAYLLEIGMVQTHVHVLARVHTLTTVARLAHRLKGGSSALALQGKDTTSDLKLVWSKGYSVQSVSVTALEVVRQYLRAQPEHHKEEAISGWEGDIAAEYDVASAPEGSACRRG